MHLGKLPTRRDAGLGVLLRYEESQYARWNGPEVRLKLLEFPIDKITDKGYWIGGPWPQFVLAPPKNGDGKRYAWPTRELALASYTARKNRQIEIYEARLRRARRGLELAKVEPL